MTDPFGVGALSEVTQFWPAAEQNSRLAPIWGYIGLNRLLWGGLGLALFGLSFLKSTRGIVKRRTKKNKFAGVVETKDIEMYPVTPKLGMGHSFSSFRHRLTHEYLTTIRSTPFVIMMGIFVALFGIVVWGAQAASPDPTIPTSTFHGLNSYLGSLALPVIDRHGLLWRRYYLAGEDRRHQ